MEARFLGGERPSRLLMIINRESLYHSTVPGEIPFIPLRAWKTSEPAVRSKFVMEEGYFVDHEILENGDFPF
jgi:hypothetical protein